MGSENIFELFKDDSGLDDGFESISHCVVELLAPPYFDDKDNIGFNAGKKTGKLFLPKELHPMNL